MDKRGFKKVKTTDALEKCIDERATADGLKYLFIDEIQNVKDFEELINGYRNYSYVQVAYTIAIVPIVVFGISGDGKYETDY